MGSSIEGGMYSEQCPEADGRPGEDDKAAGRQGSHGFNVPPSCRVVSFRKEVCVCSGVGTAPPIGLPRSDPSHPAVIRHGIGSGRRLFVYPPTFS